MPEPGSRVQIREGHAVTYDLNTDQVFRSIHIAGTLTFARDRNTRLDVGLIKIQPGDDASEDGFDCEAHALKPDLTKPRPALEVGTQSQPIPAKYTATIRLHYVEGLDKETSPRRYLLRRANGSPRRTARQYLGRNSRTTRSQMKRPLPFRVISLAGGQAIASSSRAPSTPTESEKTPVLDYHITNRRAGDCLQFGGREDRGMTIKLDKPLAFEHYAEGEFRGEVCEPVAKCCD